MTDRDQTLGQSQFDGDVAKTPSLEIQGALGASRAGFLAAAQRVGARIESHAAQRKLAAEDAWCDVARLGAPAADRLLVLVSSAPRVGGFLAAALMTRLLTDRLHRALNRNTGLVLIHAVNPFGAIWPEPRPDFGAAPIDGDRITRDPSNEDSFNRPNAGPGDPLWQSALLSAAEMRYRQAMARAPAPAGATQVGASATGPSLWGARTLRAIARGRLARARQIHLIDIQPGPGAWGALDLRALWPSRELWKDANAAPGRLLDDTGAAVDDRSDAAAGLAEFLGRKRIDSAIAVCGVGDGPDAMPSGDPQKDPQRDPLGDAALRAHFADADWTDAIWAKFKSMVTEAMAQDATAEADRLDQPLGPPPALQVMLTGRRGLRP